MAAARIPARVVTLLSGVHAGAPGCREIPDVSALAGDPYAQYCSPSFCGGDGDWVGFGGTSVAAPSWGAAVLLSDEACSTKIGFLNPLLYKEPGLLTSPIRSGNNDLTGTHDGMYEASLSGGYSMAGGLGYLGGVDLSSGALCGPGASAGFGPAAVLGARPGNSGGTGSPTTSTGGPTTSTTVPATTPGSAGSPSPGRAPARAVECVDPVNQPVPGDPDALAATEDSNNCGGYLVVTATGAVSGFGAAITYGSLQGRHLKVPVVGIAVTPDSEGYWLLTSDGQVFAFGDAKLYGAPAKLAPGTSAVGMSATPDGKGYWVVTGAGAVYPYGDAQSFGSLLGHRLNRPIVGVAATPTGDGYWLAAADGGVFGFGDARYHGSMGASQLKNRVVGITADPVGNGYFLATANGSIFSFGANFYGSRGAKPPPEPVVAVAPSIDRKGYYLIDSGGQVYAFGDAIYGGNATKPVKKRKTLTDSSVSGYDFVRPYLRLYIGDGRDDLFADDLEHRRVRHPRCAADRRLRPEFGQLVEVLDDLARSFALFSDVEVVQDGLFDLVVVAAYVFAVLTQYVEFAGEVGAAEDVARLGIFGHQLERLFLSGTADQDGRVGTGKALGAVEGPRQLVVAAVERAVVVTPHLQANLQDLFQPLEALGQRWEKQVEAACLVLVPGGADAQPRPSSRKHVEGGDDLGQHPRAAVRRTADDGHE